MHNIKQMQSLPLSAKIRMTELRIRQWYEYWDGEVYLSFSGGKDSQVLLHIIRGLYKDVPAVFVNTGMEFPSIIKHVKEFDNVVWLKPKMSFWRVIEKYGWPAVSKEQSQFIHELNRTKSEKMKDIRLNGRGRNVLSLKWRPLIGSPVSHKCCHYLKKEPLDRYAKDTGRKSIMGIMASEGGRRAYRVQCNIIGSNRPNSAPMLFWTEKDVWEYVKLHNLELAPPYYEGEKRTGCMFCLFGAHYDNFQRLANIKEKYPPLYKVFQKYGGEEMVEKIKACCNTKKKGRK